METGRLSLQHPFCLLLVGSPSPILERADTNDTSMSWVMLVDPKEDS